MESICSTSNDQHFRNQIVLQSTSNNIKEVCVNKLPFLDYPKNKKYGDHQNCNSNEQKISLQESEIQEFKNKFNLGEKYNIYLINISNYEIYGKENCFSVYYNNSIIQTESDNAQKQDLYITHNYKYRIPASFNKQYLADQIEHYMSHNEITLSKFKGFSMTNEKSEFVPTILTERPVNGPLSSFLHKKYPFNEEQKFCIACGIARGLKYIHDNGFIHSNLNPDTIYLDEKLRPKICDYVFIPSYEVKTNYNEKGITYEYTTHNISNSDSNSLFTAPELINENQSFDYSVDVYSYSLIVYSILTCSDPYTNDRNEYPENISSPWKELIDKCISRNPSSRPSFDLILDSLLNKENEFMPSQPSLNAHVYISKLKRKSKVIDIIDEMVPNFCEIDDQTRTIIEAAEFGHVECIEKVASYFSKGEQNLFHDDKWSYTCYKKAAELGSVKSMIELAKMVENGTGTEQNYSRASRIYKLALDKMDADDPERSAIELKYKETDEKSKILKIKVLSDQITSENIKSHLNLHVQYEISQENNTYELKFDTQKELTKSMKEIKKNKDIEILNQNKTKYFSLPLPLINIDDYYQGKGNNEFIKIGKGSCGDVYKVYQKGSEKIYAAKVFKAAQDEEKVNEFKREMLILSKFNHPSIIKYIGFSLRDITDSKESQCPKPTILMDYNTSYNTLGQKLRSGINWNSTQKLKCIVGISYGILNMHKHGIIHRDLKPDKILLNENLEPMICDLGSSRQFVSMNSTFDCSASSIYVAPELFNDNYSYEVDVYSFGMILYQILADSSFRNLIKSDLCLSKLFSLKMSKNSLVLPKNLNPILADLIRRCCDVSINSRPDSQTVFNILAGANKRREKLLDDIDYDSVDEYLHRIRTFAN